MYLNLIPHYKADLEQFVLNAKDFSRQGKLDLIHTIGHVLYMSANRNKDGYEISSQNYFAELSLHLREIDPLAGASRSSLCEARQKISWKAFEFLLERVRIENKELPKHYKWLGHEVFAADGSKLSLPNAPDILKEFPQRKAGGKNQKGVCHYPFGMFVTVCNVFTGQPIAAELDNMHGSERGCALSLFRHLNPGDIVLLDRGLDGKRIWIPLEKNGIHYVSRLKIRKGSGGFWGQLCAFLAGKQSDKIVEFNIKDPEDRKSTIPLKMRILRGRKLKDGSILLLATNLLNKKIYTRKNILNLYLRRWAAETLYSRVKILLNLEKFHSKKRNGIRQEIFSNLFILALAARLSLHAQGDHSAPSNENLKVPNLKNTIEVLRRYIFYWISPFRVGTLRLKQIGTTILFQISRILHRKQMGRSNPRYSRAPVNKWAMAKADKIKQHNLGRRPGASAEMREIYRRMDQKEKAA